MTVADRMQRLMIRIYLRYVSVLFCAVARIVAGRRKQPERLGKELLILKPDAIGDYLLVRNFLTLVRNCEAFRDYRVTFCGNAACRDLAEPFDREVVDEFIWIEKSAVYLNPIRYSRLISRMNGRYDITIHAVRSRELLFDFLARYSSCGERIAPEGDTVNILPLYKKHTDRWYTRLVPCGNASTFEFEANRRFFGALLGTEVNVTFPYLDLLAGTGPEPADLPEKMALVFPGAQLPFRRWAPENFAIVCRHLHEVYGLEIVLMGAPDDRQMAEKIRRGLSFPVTDLTGRTKLADVPGLIARAQIVLTNDSMAVHIAAALKVPVVVISQMNHYGRFVPYPAGGDVKMACVIPAEFTGKDPAEMAQRFRCGSDINISRVSVDQVIRATDAMLDPHTKKSGGA